MTHENLDQDLAEWVRLKRENKLPVSRRLIRMQASNLFKNTDMKVIFMVEDGNLGNSLSDFEWLARKILETAQLRPSSTHNYLSKNACELHRSDSALHCPCRGAQKDTSNAENLCS